MEHKKYMNILEARENGNYFTDPNTLGFRPGDEIVIQEKLDGANASMRYDKESSCLRAFSSRSELSDANNLRGFWNYIQTLDPLEYKEFPNQIIFGEWLVPHRIDYREEIFNKWYVFDIYDCDSEQYLLQEDVKVFCRDRNLIYIDPIYHGKFVSWDHCKSFVGVSDIALEQGEGIVVKNQTRLNSQIQYPAVLKIVIDNFKEVKRKFKIVDPETLALKELAQETVCEIVTKARVEKLILKLMDEAILPLKIAPEDMSIIAKTLPKRVFDDCLKEEPQLVERVDKYFGVLCSKETMRLAKEIIFER